MRIIDTDKEFIIKCPDCKSTIGYVTNDIVIERIPLEHNMYDNLVNESIKCPVCNAKLRIYQGYERDGVRHDR